jgi:mRNA interferase HigB
LAPVRLGGEKINNNRFSYPTFERDSGTTHNRVPGCYVLLFSFYLPLQNSCEKCSQNANFLNLMSYIYMKIRLISKQTLEDYSTANAGSRKAINAWLTTLKYADWLTPSDFKSTFGSADLLGNGSNRVVFDIGGNNYRMICKYHFGKNNIHLFVCWIGTHAEYTNLCNEKKQYTVSEY